MCALQVHAILGELPYGKTRADAKPGETQEEQFWRHIRENREKWAKEDWLNSDRE